MKSNIEWKKWGEIDPLYGVATWKGKSKNSPQPWQNEEFYALGKSDWQDFKKIWEQYGVKTGTCLEIGCGVGKITKQLSVDFDIVKAFDVSEGMINYAKKYILDSNVEFLLSDGIHLATPDDSIDAVFSAHVFQHFNDLEDALKNFHEIYRILGNKGSLMIHLPIYRWPNHRGIHLVISNFLKRIDDFKANFWRFLIRRGHWHFLMRVLFYEVDWLYNTLDQIGFEDIEIRYVRVKSNNDPHPFIFARKSILSTSTANASKQTQL